MRSIFFILGVAGIWVIYFSGNYLVTHWQQFDFSLPDSIISPSITSSITSNEKPDSKTTVYKWQDSNGKWHFGDTPPSTGNYATEQVSNVQTLKMHTPTNTPSNTKIVTDQSNNDSPSASPFTPFTEPEKIQKLIKGAQGIEGVLQQRKEAMDSQI